MKRTARFRVRWVSWSLVAVWGTVGTAFAVAQQASPSNPLRPASTQATVTSSKTTAAKSAESRPVGTAVRTTEKRTPDVQVASAEEPSVLTTSPRRADSSVAPAAYRRRVIRPSSGVPIGPEFGTSTSVLHGTVTVQTKPHEVIDGGIIYEGGAEFAPDLFHHGDSCCDSGSCSQCCLIPCPRIPWDELTVFGGVQAFTGPKNGGETGSFGFHQGVNWGAPLPCFNGCLGIQLGAQVTQANLSGAEFTSETRHQTFVTGGIFRRVDCGLQYGVAYDYQSDDWYTNTNLTQLRAEVAWVFPCAHELGFWTTASVDEDNAVATVVTNQIPAVGRATWESTDLYAFFYRHRFQGWEGAHARLFAGFTDSSDGLLGSEFYVPLTCDIALQANFAYLVPEESKGPAALGNEEESWNVGISLVWYPGCATASSKSYFRPLFNVADNGSFMVDRVR